MIGTAMGTSFAVVYANSHLIFVEPNIVYSFIACYSLYDRFLDDGICLWHGSDEDFQIYSQAFNTVDPSIKFIWSKLSKLANFLNLSIEISHDSIQYEVFSKLGNAYAYLLYGSFHVRNSFSLVEHGSKLYSQRRWLTLPATQDGAVDVNFFFRNSGNAATALLFFPRNLPKFHGVIAQKCLFLKSRTVLNSTTDVSGHADTHPVFESFSTTPI